MPAPSLPAIRQHHLSCLGLCHHHLQSLYQLSCGHAHRVTGRKCCVYNRCVQVLPLTNSAGQLLKAVTLHLMSDSYLGLDLEAVIELGGPLTKPGEGGVGGRGAGGAGGRGRGRGEQGGSHRRARQGAGGEGGSGRGRGPPGFEVRDQAGGQQGAGGGAEALQAGSTQGAHQYVGEPAGNEAVVEGAAKGVDPDEIFWEDEPSCG